MLKLEECNFGVIRYTLTRFFAENGLLGPNQQLAKTDTLLRLTSHVGYPMYLGGDKQSYLTGFFHWLNIKPRSPAETQLPTKHRRLTGFRNTYRCQECGNTKGLMYLVGTEIACSNCNTDSEAIALNGSTT
jgi:hypothetical protein